MINIDNRHPVQPELLAQLGQKQVDRIVQAFCLAQQFQRQISQIFRPGRTETVDRIQQMRIGIQLRQHHTQLIGRIQITGRPFLAIRFHILQGTFRTTVQTTELVDHRRHTHPDTDGNLQTTPGIRKQLRYLCRDHPPDNGCPCLVAIPDKQHELIATKAKRNIVHPGYFASPEYPPPHARPYRQTHCPLPD